MNEPVLIGGPHDGKFVADVMSWRNFASIDPNGVMTVMGAPGVYKRQHDGSYLYEHRKDQRD